MPRLRVLSGREVCRILTTQGYIEARRKGSHVIMQRVEQASTISVPVPDHKELRTGTLMSIIELGELLH